MYVCVCVCVCEEREREYFPRYIGLIFFIIDISSIKLFWDTRLTYCQISHTLNSLMRKPKEDI